MIEYSKVAVDDSSGSGNIQGGHSTANCVLISKPPTQRRDGLYPLIYIVIAVIMIVISCIVEKKPYSGSLISASFAGNWVSMIMIAPLLASFVGISLFVMLCNPTLRTFLLSSSVFIAGLCKLCIGNVFLLTTDLWFVGLIILVSLFGDWYRYSLAKENLSSSISMIEMGIELNEPFDSMLMLVCFVVVMVQMFVLLWWGVVFVYAVSEVGKVQGVFVVLMFVLFLFWIVQFFHNATGLVVQGCYLWLFVRPPDTSYRRTDHVHQVMLCTRCAVGASLGSICKASVLVVPAQAVLSATCLLRWRLRSYGDQSRCTSWYAPRLLAFLMHTAEPWARQYHRQALAYVAVYGHTLHKAAAAISGRHPEIVDMMTLDSTSFILKMICTWTSVVVSAILVAITSIETQNLGSVWPLFFFQCYVLVYSCISLSLHGCRCVVDTLILAFAESPEEFAEKNSLLYHRFLRINELDMD